MALYVVCDKYAIRNHAGTKARDDVKAILNRLGWKTLTSYSSEDKGLLDKLRSIPIVYLNWQKICRTVSKGDIVLIQYPLVVYPRVSLSAIPAMKRMRAKGVKFIFLIHDLPFLRGYNYDVVDLEWLSFADVIIAHNQAMIEVLNKHGIAASMVDLCIFDYCLSSFNQTECNRKGIDIAGNLQPSKAGYVYQLHTLDNEVQFNLYGPNFNKRSVESKWYKGSLSPQALPQELKGLFGLVWDGNSIDTCSGDYGNYLKVNNPHKLSLYLASDMPVIIWAQAAEASFVIKNDVGIAANSIGEAVSRIGRLSEDDYGQMKNHASEIGKQIRDGAFAKAAVLKALNIIGM